MLDPKLSEPKADESAVTAPKQPIHTRFHKEADDPGTAVAATTPDGGLERARFASPESARAADLDPALLLRSALDAGTLRSQGRLSLLLGKLLDRHESTGHLLSVRSVDGSVEPQTLIREGERSKKAYVLLPQEGAVVDVFQRQPGPSGLLESIPVRRLTQFPALCGEMRLFFGEAQADVRVSGGPVLALEFDVNELYQLARDDRSVSAALESLVAERLEHNGQKRIPLTLGDLKSRTAPDSLIDCRPEEAAVISAFVQCIEAEVAGERGVLGRLLPGAWGVSDREVPGIHVRTYPKGARVMTETVDGQEAAAAEALDPVIGRPPSVFFVTEGRVNIFKRSLEGDHQEVFVAARGAGLVIGEAGQRDPRHRRFATAIAANEGLHTVEISGDLFARLYGKYPDFAAAVDELHVVQRKALRDSLETSITVDYTPSLSDLLAELARPENLASETAVRGLISDFNNLNPAPRKDLFNFLAQTPFGAVIVNEQGALELVAIDKHSAPGILARIKRTDPDGRHDSYDLRMRCYLEDPNGESYAYFTNNKTRPISSFLLLKRLLKDTSWLPERQELWSEVITPYFDRVRQSNEQLARVDGDPVLVFVGGNTGAGKTFTLKKLAVPLLEELHIDPDFVLNPDDVKYDLRVADQRSGVFVPSPKVHSEGVNLLEGLIADSLRSGSSIVVDKRFTHEAEVQALAAEAKRLGYRTVFVDVIAELETSINRVYGNTELGIVGRDPHGRDPVPPREAIHQGYDEGTSHRVVKLESERSRELIDQWIVVQTDAQVGAPVLLASQKDGVVAIEPEYAHLYARATRDTSQDAAIAREVETLLRVDPSFEAGEEEREAARKSLTAGLEFLSSRVTQEFRSPAEVEEFVRRLATVVNFGVPAGDAYRAGESPVTDARRDYVLENLSRILMSTRLADPIESAAWIEHRLDHTDRLFEHHSDRIGKLLASYVLKRAGIAEGPHYPTCREYSEHTETILDDGARRQYFQKEYLPYYRSLFGLSEERGFEI